MSRPIVVIPACTTLIEGYVFDAVGRKYSAAVAEVADCQPLLMPVGPGVSDIGSILEVADAILLTGSRSNVAPEHYGEKTPILPDAREQTPSDRDARRSRGPASPCTARGRLPAARSPARRET